MEEKTPSSHEVIGCFQMLDFGTSKSNSEVSKSKSKFLVEINYFSKSTLLQRKPFLTMLPTALHCLLRK